MEGYGGAAAGPAVGSDGPAVVEHDLAGDLSLDPGGFKPMNLPSTGSGWGTSMPWSRMHWAQARMAAIGSVPVLAAGVDPAPGPAAVAMPGGADDPSHPARATDAAATSRSERGVSLLLVTRFTP